MALESQVATANSGDDPDTTEVVHWWLSLHYPDILIHCISGGSPLHRLLSMAANTVSQGDIIMGARVVWGGNSYTVTRPGEPLNDVPGVFLFCKRNPKGHWIPAYISHTDSDSLAQLRTQSALWQEADILEATHIHSMPMQRLHLRKMVVSDLIQEYRPCLDTAQSLHKTVNETEDRCLDTGSLSADITKWFNAARSAACGTSTQHSKYGGCRAA